MVELCMSISMNLNVMHGYIDQRLKLKRPGSTGDPKCVIAFRRYWLPSRQLPASCERLFDSSNRNSRAYFPEPLTA